MTLRRPAVLGLVWLAVVGPAPSQVVPQAAGPEQDPLVWRLLPQGSLPAVMDDLGVVQRSRPVEVQFATLRDAHEGDWLRAVSHDGREHRIWIETAEILPFGNLALTGKYADDPLASFAAVVGPGAFAGNFRTSHGYFQVRPRTDGPGHEIRDIDETRFPGCAMGPSQHRGPAGQSPGTTDSPSAGAGGAQARADDGTIFDVLVLWTSLAEAASGGVSSMNVLVDLAVLETNQAYAASLVNSRLRLVYKGKTAYGESNSFGGHLNQFESKVDGVMDEVHAIRDAVGADLCALLVRDGTYCGIANLMTNVSPGFEDHAFSVTNWSCATGYYSFGHELGHNMGCAHDHANGSSGAYSYSFGHRFFGQSGQEYRTVMAYAPGIRIPRFSNPNVTYNGTPTGVSGGSQAAENARSINNAASTIANWRGERFGTTAILFSSRNSTTLQGILVEEGDILSLDLASGAASMVIDLSDVIPGAADVNGLHQLADGSFLLTFRLATTVPGLIGGPNGAAVDQNDIVRFVPVSLGNNTAGSFEFFFDGSDVELDTWQEDIDGLSMDGSGNLILSLRGSWTIQGGSLSGEDEDIVQFTPTSLGAVTSGSFAILIDGSGPDVRLHAKGEDVDAVHYHPETGDISLSVTGSFRVPSSQKGEDQDLITFVPTAYGVPTTGLFRFTFNGEHYGLANVDFDAIHIVP